MIGVVTKLFAGNGYLFIEGKDGVSRFAHASWVEWGKFETLEVGMRVRFTPAMGEKGAQARDVTPVGEA